MSTSRLATAALGTVALLAGCNGLIGGAGEPAGGTGTGAGTGTGTGTGTGGTTGTTITPNPLCAASKGVMPGRAPLRRLTRFEYNNTVKDLLGDTTSPASSLPAEVLGNGFGNDADLLSVSSLLAEQYYTVAEGIAARATATSQALAKLAPCASSVTATTEETCARTIINALVPRAYRRPLATGEADDLLTLYKTVRPKTTFAGGVAAVIQAVLQAPDFLYRVEFGVPDPSNPALRRPTGHEMATRLSYLFWGTMPDDALRAAATDGTLLTKEGVLAQATRLLGDQRSHAIVGFFFDSLLPINGLTDLERDAATYPTFSRTIGSLLHQETQRFLEYEIFEGGGTWPSAFTAPYTFVNQTLAGFYGMSGVQGDTFQKVPLDTTKRLGFLTQAGMMAGTTPSNTTNPVLRGSFIVQKLMCRKIPLPTGDILAKVKPPDPYSGATARERFTKHSADPVCAACHQYMDPLGLALENYDPIGQYRTQENNVTIDASGSVPGMPGAINGGVELARKLAESQEVQNCFATHWIEYGYGRTLTGDDVCLQEAVNDSFKKSGYNVRQLLLSLTQTDSFQYLPVQ